MNIIFVCTGNTCRSPMAEGFLKQLIQNDGSDDICVSSRGIAADCGAPASANSILAASELGADISAHTAKQFTNADAESADLILTMTAMHASLIRSAFPAYAHKVFELSKFAGCDEISDPYGSDADTYRKCSAQISAAVQTVFSKISGNAQ